MRLFLVLVAALVLVAGCGSDGTTDRPEGASSSVAGQTPGVGDPTSTRGAVRLEVEENATQEPGELVLRVVATLPAPGIRAYEILVNYDEGAVTMLELQDVAFTERALMPVCVNFPENDAFEDGDLHADLACGLPQKAEAGPSGEVTLARFKARAKSAGETTFSFSRALASPPDLSTTYELEVGDPLVVNLTPS